MISVTASIYNAALTFAAENDVRYYLNGVRVEPSPQGVGVLLVATNGHALCVLHDRDGTCDAPVILPRIDIASRNRKPRAMVHFDAHTATMSDDSTVPARFVVGRYPDIRATVDSCCDTDPDASCAHVSVLSTRYLALLESIRIAYGVNTCPAVLSNRDKDKPILIAFDGIPAFVLIWQMRWSESRDPHKLPAFWHAPTITPCPDEVHEPRGPAEAVEESEPSDLAQPAIA